MPRGYQIETRNAGRDVVAVFTFSAEEAEDVALMIPPTDGFHDELLEAAEEIRKAEGGGT